LIKRLSDGFTTLYANTDIKKYNPASPLFNSLPKEISTVLLNKFDALLDPDLTKLTKFDKFDVPAGVQLFHDETVKDNDHEQTLEPENELQQNFVEENLQNDEEENLDPEQNILGDLTELQEEERPGIIQNPSDSESSEDDSDQGMVLRNKKRVSFKN